MTDSELVVIHGYRLPGGTNPLAAAAALRDMAEPIRAGLELREVAFHAASILDAADLAGSPRPASVMFDAISAQAEHVAAIMSGEHSCPTVTLGMAFTDDPVTGDVMALAFHHHEEYARGIDELGIAEYFPYWDEETTGQPRPLGISSSEWAARGIMWERALRGTDPQDPTGTLRIEFGSPLPGVDLLTRAGDILGEIPSMEHRIHRALNELAQSQDFESPAEAMAFMAAMPAHHARVEESLKPISLADLAGGTK
ncbi:hypothetical protein [Arthrobacter sp. IK3]|uniref:hypothetical protein n=1 Tax=Arthrobacter sp. IK3 TaxID=3448169 RepID=UPI003EE3B68F